MENNEDFLTKTIEKWMEGIKISCLFSFIMDVFYIYKTYYDITKNKEIKDALKKVFIEMTKYIKSKETLILTLLLGEFVHKPLRFVLSTPYTYAWEPNRDLIVFGTEQAPMEYKVQEFYHEFNHRIHDLLGIYFDHSLVGKINSQFEQDLFKFPDTPVIGLKKFHTRFIIFS